MLNDKNVRELAYVVKIDSIEPIVGSDNCEAAIVGGWRVMVRKNTFKVNDLAIYFEIDSKVDTSKPEFAFLEKKHGKIKTQKYTFGGKGLMISQGLLMPLSDFPELFYMGDNGAWIYVKGDFVKEYDFLTETLGVKYSSADDNKRKGKGPDKYKKMAQRHGKLFSKQPFRWLMKRNWGKKLLFVFFGKKRDSRNWPAWVVKTDEERVQNMPWILEDKSEWIATEKIDGTSTTFTMKRGKFGRKEFYVCSRNVMFDDPTKNCYYDTNVYIEMAEKYNVKEVLSKILDTLPELEWVTLQGETYGEGIQKRDYSLKGHDFVGFNFITPEGRWDSRLAASLMSAYGIPWVPIVDCHFIMPDTVDELIAIATGKSEIDGGMREGLVFRSPDGSRSFKAVSNEFLLRYHN